MAPKKKVDATSGSSSNNNQSSTTQNYTNIPKSIATNSTSFPLSIRLTIFAKPNSSTSQIATINDEEIGVQIAAPPKEGEANKELCEYIAGVLGLSKSKVSLDKGGKSKHKILLVEIDKDSAKSLCPKGKEKQPMDVTIVLEGVYEKLRNEI
ncbi:hypothetical protein C9374_011267 [Naegleria lovaniensis]|uniref:DUF167 domain-containing protein n=1 Tax=Naegleria lovaniensis TaxID=51637 RepID=A0AA88KQP9_NAELO|nr:uncharacterized protein C9374_011267 [Naegleria lovaniensis]KAG2392542.1 hypothetical protein C9374_011267 [Naegleria lovaniensis]